MEANECHDSYPWWIVVLSNLVSVAIYGLGAYIIYQAGWIYMTIYLAFILILDIRLLKGHCVNCYYYGKACAFGKGRVSDAFFKRGDPACFSEKHMTWWDMVPDILVGLIPVIVGSVLLVRDFSWIILAAMLGLLLLATLGNSAVRSTLACRRCKQQELGCPAQELFQKAET